MASELARDSGLTPAAPEPAPARGPRLCRARSLRPGRAALAGLLAAAAFAVGVPVRGEEDAPSRGRLIAGLGFDWSEGEYEGTRNTAIAYGSLRLGYLTPELSWTPGVHDWIELRTTLAALQVDGPAVVRRTGADPDQIDTRVSGGFGDVLVRASYGFQLARRGPWPYVEVAGQLKIPTADEDEGLGTGELDTTVEVSLSHTWRGFTPFVLGARRFMGDPPDVNLHDRWLWSAGATQSLGRYLSVGGSYDFREAPSSGTRDSRSLTGYLSWKTGNVRVSPYALLGLSKGSPDYAVGAELRFELEL